jgi:thiol-disulfide isomerase/thioredoxin
MSNLYHTKVNISFSQVLIIMNYIQFFCALPVLLLLLFSAVAASGIFNSPTESSLPKVAMSEVIPVIDMPALGNSRLTNADVKGRVAIIHAFTINCQKCEAEHEALMRLANLQRVAIYGIAVNANSAQVTQWIRAVGNPYQKIAIDENAAFISKLGIDNAPQTLLIDQKGIVRHHTKEFLTVKILLGRMLPMADSLQTTQNVLDPLDKRLAP